MADSNPSALWHHRPWAGWVIRACGLLLLLTAWRAGVGLVAHSRLAPEDGIDDVLALTAFIGASFGLASTLLGPHLFDQVPIASRWGHLSPLDRGDRAPAPAETLRS